ncbi:MAG: hypothetical protein AAFQ40_01560 [Cyanobacteria bacterium J06623_5]
MTLVDDFCGLLRNDIFEQMSKGRVLSRTFKENGRDSGVAGSDILKCRPHSYKQLLIAAMVGAILSYKLAADGAIRFAE